MNRRRLTALVRKDWRELLANKQAAAPLIVVPILFAVVMPAMLLFFGDNPALTANVNGLDRFLETFPTELLPAGLTPEQGLIYAVVAYFFAPFFLLIPVMVASVIASSGFVGEKERHTFEGLVYTPLTDRELVLGKVLASVLPAIALSWVSFAAYCLLVTTLGRPYLGDTVFPTPMWLVLVFVLSPLIAFLSTALTVAISARSSTMQGAQNVSLFLVLPVILVVASQATGAFFLGLPLVLAGSVALAVIDVAVYLLVVSRLDRERILTSL